MPTLKQEQLERREIDGGQLFFFRQRKKILPAILAHTHLFQIVVGR